MINLNRIIKTYFIIRLSVHSFIHSFIYSLLRYRMHIHTREVKSINVQHKSQT